MKIAYIYTLEHPETGAIRYVGKTKNNKLRQQDHIKGSGRNTSPKCLWVIELKKTGLRPVMKITRTVLYWDDSDWKAAEIEEIKKHRDAGCNLLNCNKGGGSGYDHKPETIDKIRVQATARMDDAERAHLSKKCTGWKQTDTVKKIIADSKRGISRPDEVNAAFQAGSKKYKEDAGFHEMIRCVKCGTIIKFIKAPKFFVEGIGHIHKKCRKLL